MQQHSHHIGGSIHKLIEVYIDAASLPCIEGCERGARGLHEQYEHYDLCQVQGATPLWVVCPEHGIKGRRIQLITCACNSFSRNLQAMIECTSIRANTSSAVVSACAAC